MVTYFDYDEVLAVARKLKKPLMLDITGINCANCRKMEGQVWSDAEVMKKVQTASGHSKGKIQNHTTVITKADYYGTSNFCK